MPTKERKRDKEIHLNVKLRGVHAERYERLKQQYEATTMAEVIRRVLQDAEKGKE